MSIHPAARPQVETHLLGPCGAIPNNPRLALLLYRGVLDQGDGEARAIGFEALFGGNGWTNGWRDSIYRYHHFHANAHEVLGIAEGHARVRFGGEAGVAVDIAPGDVVVIPAGVAHCRLDDDPRLLVIAGYPDGAAPDMHRETVQARRAIAAQVARVPVPTTDPVYGGDGPLIRCWRG